MSAKEVKFSQEAREKMIRGIDVLANAVRVRSAGGRAVACHVVVLRCSYVSAIQRRGHRRSNQLTCRSMARPTRAASREENATTS